MSAEHQEASHHSSFDHLVTNWVTTAQELDSAERLELLDRTLKAVQQKQRLNVYAQPPKEVKLNMNLLTPKTAPGAGSTTARGGPSIGPKSSRKGQAEQKSMRRMENSSPSHEKSSGSIPPVTEADARDLEDQIVALTRSIESVQRRGEKERLALLQQQTKEEEERRRKAQQSQSPAREDIDLENSAREKTNEEEEEEGKTNIGENSGKQEEPEVLEETVGGGEAPAEEGEQTAPVEGEENNSKESTAAAEKEGTEAAPQE